MTATTTRFEFDLRMLLCEACGAPIDAAPNGGTVTCRFCSAVFQVGPRVVLPEFGPVAAAALAEPVRLARLTAQVDRKVVAPASLAPLLEREAIPSWRAKEALAVWQSLRKRALQGDLVAAEELSYLTNLLWVGLDAEPERQRALLESTLETLTLARHRQLVLGALAQGAVRAGDRTAAERWLSRCDSSLDDLDADSSYRVARALVATMRSDWADVLAVLGARTTDVPLAAGWLSLANLLRGNAHVRSGDDVSAREVLKSSYGVRLAQESARFPGLVSPDLPVRADRAIRVARVWRLAVSSLLTVSGGGMFVMFVEASRHSALAIIPVALGAAVCTLAGMVALATLVVLVFSRGVPKP